MVESMRLVQTDHPGETVLGRGVAKCTALDKEILERHVSSLGRSGGMRLLEADWVATDAALYYVTPRTGSVLRWPWDQIVSVAKGRRGLLTAGVDIRFTNGSVMTWKLAGTSAAELSAIASRPKVRPPDSQPPPPPPVAGGPNVKSLFTPAEWEQIRGLPSAVMAMVTYADGVAEDGEVAATIRELMQGQEQYAGQLAKAMAAEQAQDLMSRRPTPASSMNVRSAMGMIRTRVAPAEYKSFVFDLADSLWAVASQTGGSFRFPSADRYVAERFPAVVVAPRNEFRHGMTATFLRECGVDPQEWLAASRWAR